MLGKIARSPAKLVREELLHIVNRNSFKGVWRDPCPLAIFSAFAFTKKYSRCFGGSAEALAKAERPAQYPIPRGIKGQERKILT